MPNPNDPAPGRSESLRVDDVAGGAGMRLDQFLAAGLGREGPGPARALVQKWIKDGRVSLGGAPLTKASRKMAQGEEIVLVRPAAPRGLTPEAGAVSVLYRDAELLVIDKPAGLTVHPAPGLPAGTLANRLAALIPELAAMGGDRPGVVHRLDKDTSGVMLVAVSESARRALAADFAGRRVDKTYLALVYGRPAKDTGLIEAPIGRDPRHPTRMAVTPKGGRPAKTAYEVLWADPAGALALLGVTIFTGRTHQIRVHLAHIGHPVLGDAVYAGGARAAFAASQPLLSRLARRQLLHAWRIAVTHPGSGERLVFTAPAPKDMANCLRLAMRQQQRLIVTGAPGSGKSEVMRLLARAGYPVFSADAAVAALYRPGGDGAVLLGKRFGERFVKAPGAGVDKPALRAAMLGSEALRREVENLIHPLVRHELAVFYRQHRRAPVTAAEIPLYFEAGWGKAAPGDVSVCVSCPRQERWRRLAARGLTPAAIAAMEAWQIDPEVKASLCDHVLTNAGSLDALGEAVSGLCAKLRAARTGRARAFVFPLPAGPDGPASPIA